MPVVVSLQNLSQDIQSYERIIDGVLDKAQSLAKTSSDPKLTADIARVNDRYRKLCSLSKASLYTICA